MAIEKKEDLAVARSVECHHMICDSAAVAWSEFGYVCPEHAHTALMAGCNLTALRDEKRWGEEFIFDDGNGRIELIGSREITPHSIPYLRILRDEKVVGTMTGPPLRRFMMSLRSALAARDAVKKK
jgi:hypothetical protein